MSSIKVTNLQHASAASPNIVLDANGNATMAGTMAMASSFLRNRVINGAMEIDQRNAGASVTITSSQTYTVDRWWGEEVTDGTMSAQRSSVAPEGFINSVVLTTGTADTSLSAAQYVIFSQSLEGLNVADLAWGTASAKTITISFWVRSSLTGTFGGSIRNNGNTRSYIFTYSITAANTWEYKTITIAGDTSGTWLTTNGVGVSVSFCLGAGSNFNGTVGAWASANTLTASGAVSVIGTAGATFYLTGVQLEVGSVATPFERRLYTTELQLAQRYYCTGHQRARTDPFPAGALGASAFFPVTMRATPTVTATAVLGTFNSLDVYGPTSAFFQFSAGASGNIANTFTASAEL